MSNFARITFACVASAVFVMIVAGYLAATYKPVQPQWDLPIQSGISQ